VLGIGPEWHTHLAKTVITDACQIAAVGTVTFEEPSATVVAKHDNIKVVNVKKGTLPFTDAVSGAEMEFTAGSSAVDPNPVSGELGVVFPLVPVFGDPEVPASLQVICMGPPAEDNQNRHNSSFFLFFNQRNS